MMRQSPQSHWPYRSRGFRRERGLTVIELSVVLLITGLLISVSIASYRSLLLKNHRIVAQAALLELVSRQAQFFANNLRYALTFDELRLPSPYFISGTATAVESRQARYEISWVVDDARWLGFKAIPMNGQRQDEQCGTLSITRIGERSATGRLSTDCW